MTAVYSSVVQIARLGTEITTQITTQIQQLYDLSIAIVTSSMKLITSITAQLGSVMKANEPSCRTEPIRAPLVSSPMKTVANNPTMSTSSQLDPPVTITETSDTMSREATPVRDLEVVANVKLSLWIQWTIPKFVWAIYSFNDSGRDLRVVTEIEDVATSIDVQDVYSKVKVKVGMLNVSHEMKETAESAWCTGDHEGLLFTSCDKLNQNVVIVTNKPWAGTHVAPHPVPNLFVDSHGDLKPRDKTHGFLTVTFTRALRTNVKKRMKKMACDGFTNDDQFSSSKAMGQALVYLNELCINLQPADIIANCPVLSKIITVLTWRCSTLEEMQQKSVGHGTPKVACNRQETTLTGSDSAMPLLTPTILPLIYINTGNLRLLFPHGDSCCVPLGGDAKLHDVWVAQLRALTLTPIADNPLPRTVVEKEVYRRAIHAGITQQPGSEVEDRQYQLDIAGLSLSTCRWCDLIVDRTSKEEDSLTVQHPALEWNNLRRQRIEKEEVRITPVATAFDLRVVAAPAIVYSHITPQGASVPLLVCGHSLELNATSDIDLYLSNTQIKLALDVFSTNIAALLGVSTVLKVDGGSGRWEWSMDDRREDGGILHDSGVESETSTVAGFHHKMPAVVMTSPEPYLSEECDDSTASQKMHGGSCFVPFDVLLTAGKLSFMTYMHEIRLHEDAVTDSITITAPIEILTKDSGCKTDLEMKVPPNSELYQKDYQQSLFLIPSVEDMPKLDLIPEIEPQSPSLTNTDSGIDLEGHQVKVTSESHKELNSKGESVCKDAVHVVPFLYATFSQPHTMLKMDNTNQKLELSCYDIILKGPKPGHSFQEDSHVIPDFMDYGVHWIETKPGDANPKTGIPPSLYTLRVIDFLIRPADLLLKIERPLKLNGSITQVNQVMTYINDLLPHFSSLFPTNAETKTSHQEKIMVTQKSTSIIAPLTRVRSIQVVAVQIVMHAETHPGPKSPSIQLSSSHFDTTVTITTSNADSLQAIDLSITLQDLLLKTAYGGTLHPLLGPLSVNFTVDANWSMHSGPAHLPSILCCLEAGLIPITVGQENMLCLQLLTEDLVQFIQSHTEPTVTKENSPDPVNQVKSNQRSHRSYVDLDLQASVDDLRAGDFEYNTVDSSPDSMPQPGEIVFSVDCDEGQATMTWCYPEPRVITFLYATPVPFALPQQLDARFIDEDLKIPCILQYYNNLCHDFEDYAAFTVSQSEPVSVPLQEVTSQMDPEIVTAQIWRTLILHPRDTIDQSEVEDHLEPLISPLTLAASLRVDSCFCRGIIPMLQLAASASSIQIRPSHHLRHLSNDVPSKLQPYKLDPAYFTHDHEFALITMENPTVTLARITGTSQRVTAEVNASVQCDIIEYRNLTMRPLLENVDIMCQATWQIHTEQTLLKVRSEVGPLYLRVGESAVHTLNTASHAFTQLSEPGGACIIPHYYLICNNTRELLRVAQVGTDEEVTIRSHQVSPYGWRSHKIQQLIQLGIEGYGAEWSDPIDIDVIGITECVLEHKGHKAKVIVKVKALTSIQKQVEISGLLLVASRLNQDLEVKVIRPKNKEDKLASDGGAVLASRSSLPSYIIDTDRACAVRVKLFGLKTSWSQEIAVSGEEAKESRLVKVPLANKGSFIHIWCHVFKEHHRETNRTIVLFVPLFTVRAHFPMPLLMNVETPRRKSSRREELQCQGHEEHMFMVGGDMTHNITFQLSPKQQPSSPPIALSSGMIEQVPRYPLEKITAEGLLSDWEEDLSKAWPYNDIEDVNSSEPFKSPIGSSTTPVRPATKQEVAMAVPHGDNSTTQPNIDLQISLRQRWHGCNTLLIDIAPCWIMVNETSLDLVIIENNEHQWQLAGKQTFAPPLFTGPFRLGLVFENRLHMSDPLTLTDQEMTFRYLQDEEDKLYNEGHLKVIIPVVVNQMVMQMCHLTLHSLMRHAMRVVTLRETYVFSNHIGFELNVQGFCLPLSKHKVPLDHSKVSSVTCSTRSKGTTDDIIPIPIWHAPTTSGEVKVNPSADVAHVQYLALQKSHKSSLQEQYDDEIAPWALASRIKISEQGWRSSLAIPLGGNPFRVLPGVLTCHQRAGVVYLILTEEPDPGMQIHNNCAFTICYGQGLIGLNAEDITVQEEAELTTDVLTVPPGGSTCYTFPAINAHYPQVTPLGDCPRLHLAGYVTTQAEVETQRMHWSIGLDLESEHDMFVNIPGVSDAKVHTEKVGHTLHVFIDPVSRAEISAKEIRSRIKGKEKIVLVEMPKTPEAKPSVNPLVLQQSPSSVDIKTLIPSQKKPLRPLITEICVVCSYASFILLDENSNPKVVSELLRVTADKLAILYFPLDLYDPFQQMRPQLSYTLTMTCCDLQIDNQIYTGQTYDFPVVFKRQSERHEIDFSDSFFHLSPQDQLRKLKQASLIAFEMTLCADLTVRMSSLTGVQLNLKPVIVFVEDTFIYDILGHVSRFANGSLTKQCIKPKRQIIIPNEVQLVCWSLSHPVRLTTMVIEPVAILLNVHASLKLFIASENTPLSFSRFERCDIFTNTPQLIRAAALHYASGALFRAGWVVGSLEILGNPTGLVRNVGMGISDMFRLPYHGLTQGPGAFVGGVTRGMGSLVRHISTGAITSVTNFASSVSRNMDRLSMDDIHRARQEEGRRFKPRGVSDGLLNGLSGFGMSLLGAIAGIADQPLQMLTYEDDKNQQPTNSPSRTASGLVSGVGKGLLGAITKPIGGAAELVSQTGLGLLQGSGLTRFPTPCHSPITEPIAGSPGSTLKVIEKLLSTVLNTEVLAMVEALCVNKLKSPLQQDQVSLLLTKEIFFIINPTDDTCLQAYDITQISCCGNAEDPSFLGIIVGAPKSQPFTRDEAIVGQLHCGNLPKDQMNNKDRVAAFLGGATSAGGFEQVTKKDQTETTPVPIHAHSAVLSMKHELHLDPQSRYLFMAHFSAAKRKVGGIGFPV